MKTTRLIAALAAAAALAAVAGCSKNDDQIAATTGHVNVVLTDDPAVYDKVNLVVTGVAIHRGDSDTTAWETLRSDSTTIDLLTLQNGATLQLATADAPAAHYTQIRLLLGAGSTIVVDGVTHPLVIPSGQQTGLKIVGGFDVPPGGTVELTLDFDASRSIIVTGNGTYILRPVVRMIVNRGSTAGSITGRIVPDSLGASVYAISGADTVQTARAQTNGQFTLSTLIAGTYTVAIHPDTAYRDTSRTSVLVTAGHVTNLGDITLTHNPAPAAVVAIRRRS
ncbi:MAG: DUF4382 domain-containing protein [Candidatus Eisenbacteria bacterium]|uniref:DUF4382 domain-containing protein n=1 Tax=Eiseniibacteriota bacterium TaxID=2212470 RepID=A0A538TXG6_UNCEI|nr:MAG: DUF4382 domain-containing protein [Candidatus Eisenbacteria bacterium]